MAHSRNEQLFRIVVEEGFSRGNLAALDGLFDPGLQEHQFGLPSTADGLKSSISGLRAAFPDFTLTVDEVVSDGDKVWGRSTARGTHRGLFMGLPPTGRQFAIQVFDVCRFKDGKIVEHWGAPDRFALMVQLGALPGPGQGPRGGGQPQPANAAGSARNG